MIFTCRRFTGYYPVGTAAIVTALCASEAADMLNEALRQKGLPGDARPEDFVEYEGGTVILNDGNY